MTEIEKLKEKIAELPERNVPTSSIKPNPWNFNTQPKHIFNSLKAALQRYGRIYPIIVREVAGPAYEIIDGEHRWRALMELEVSVTPVKNLGQVSDVVAKELMMILNKTRGEANPEKLGLSLSRIVKAMEEDGDDPATILPFSDEQLQRLLSVTEDFKMDPEQLEVKDEDFEKMKGAAKLCTDHAWKRIEMKRCKICGTLAS